MSDHIMTSSWVGSEDAFLFLGFFRQNISPRIGHHRKTFLFKRMFLAFVTEITPTFRS